MSSRFERTGSREVWSGHLGSLHVATFRHEDGEEVEREVFAHPGAVAVVAHDGAKLYLVRQPREAVGLFDMLELPAGKLDAQGEAPLDTAKRELAEEIGRAASHWEHLVTYHSSPGFTDEQVHVYLATGLTAVEPPETDENERIEMVVWPLEDLDELIQEVTDAKTLIGLLEYRRRRQDWAIRPKSG